jgi:hypothetical protein
MFDNADYSTEVSRRERPQPVQHVIEAARMGADVVTVPPARHRAAASSIPLTDVGLERFLKDWEKAQAAKVYWGCRWTTFSPILIGARNSAAARSGFVASANPAS